MTFYGVFLCDISSLICGHLLFRGFFLIEGIMSCKTSANFYQVIRRHIALTVLTSGGNYSVRVLQH